MQIVRPQVTQMELKETKVSPLEYEYIRILEQFLTVSPTHILKTKSVIWINLFFIVLMSTDSMTFWDSLTNRHLYLSGASKAS